MLTNDLPVLQADLAVGHAGQFHVMGHDDKGLFEFFPEYKEHLMQFLFVLAVKVTGRFVCQDHCRIIDKRPGNRHPLLFPARELRRFVFQPVLQVQESQQFPCPGFHFPAWPPGDKPGYTYIFEGTELRQQMMELEDKAYFQVPELSQLFFAE
jgi:hypothetical protein